MSDTLHNTPDPFDPNGMAEDSAFGSYTIPEVPYSDETLTESEKQARRFMGSAESSASVSQSQAATASDEAAGTRIKPRYDIHLWGTFLFLVCFSIVEIFSASSQEVKIDNIYGPVIRHGMFLLIGVTIAVYLQRVHFKYIYRFIPLYVALSMVMMIAVLFVGVRINGAMRGMQFGPFTVLPAEFMKLGAVLGVALILSRNQVKGRRDVTKEGTIQATALMIICAGLLITQGLSNALLVIIMSLCMMLISGMSMRKFFSVVLALVICAIVGLGGKAILSGGAKVTPEQKEQAILDKAPMPVDGVAQDRSSTWSARISRFMKFNKHLDEITEENRQEQLSFIAQAHGGLSGVGIGNSRENSRLPLAFSDYIYAIVIEEWGMIFALFILLCYLWMLTRAARIGSKCSSTFACLLVCGCAVFVVCQALYHMAIVTGVAPVSGQPLPLISKGGTSIIVTCIAIGCMLSVSSHAAFKGDLIAKKREFASLPESIRNENPSQL